MKRILVWACLLCFANGLFADTFKNINSGETFNGFVTTKQAAGKTLVFRQDQNKFVPMDISEYEVSYGPEGRRDSVMIIAINKPEILLSEVISQTLADSITKAADTGPRLIVVQIDTPGGNGSYMKNITQAIVTARQRTGCPVAAYISGGQHGGAFAAAGVIALACDRIYMAPNAAIGAVGPVAATAMSNEEYIDYLQTYSPVTLATFGTHAAMLAGTQNRPAALARALVDKSVTTVEVRDLAGRITVVEESARANDQTVVRVVSEGLNEAAMSAEPAVMIQGIGKLLNLSASEAVRLKMADKIINAYPEILADFGLTDVQTVRTPGVDDSIQKFNAARRNLGQLLTTISQNEDRISFLRDQLTKMEEMSRTGVRIRERNETTPMTEEDRRISNYFRYEPRTRDQGYVVYGQRAPRNYRVPSSESTLTEEPVGNIQQVQYELMQILNNTIPVYRRAIGLARRWAGALPAGVSVQTLQNGMDSSQALLMNLQRDSERLQYPR